MKAIELVRMALRMTDEGTASLVKDMRERPLTRPVSDNGRSRGNHPLWILGHLAFIEGSLRPILLGEDVARNPVEHWRPLFATGTQPLDDPGRYPTFDEVLATLRALRITTLALLDEIGDDGLDRVPKSPPPGLEDGMRTFGQTMLLIALHQMVHYGQIADARRVAGIAPPF
jgi:hypothetical protein